MGNHVGNYERHFGVWTVYPSIDFDGKKKVGGKSQYSDDDASDTRFFRFRVHSCSSTRCKLDWMGNLLRNRNSSRTSPNNVFTMESKTIETKH